MSMTIQVAKEHIKDGTDCILEALKAIKRVKKNFPSSEDKIGSAESHLNEARSILADPDDVIPDDALPRL